MTQFSELVQAVNTYIVNPDGSLKLDSLGRRRHINQKNGTKLRGEALLVERCIVKLDKETKDELIQMAIDNNTSMSELVRKYIVWGLETEGEG